MAKGEAKAKCPRCGLVQQVTRFPASCSNCSAMIVKRRPLEDLADEQLAADVAADDAIGAAANVVDLSQFQPKVPWLDGVEEMTPKQFVQAFLFSHKWAPEGQKKRRGKNGRKPVA